MCSLEKGFQFSGVSVLSGKRGFNQSACSLEKEVSMLSGKKGF